MSAATRRRVFFDTNILIYTVARDERRSEAARSLLLEGGNLSVQVLNEFVNVSRRKLRKPWHEIEQALESLRLTCEPVHSLTDKTHRLALELAQRHHFNIYDATILASAIEAGCNTLYSEDMQHGQQIETVTIRNPFLQAPTA
jgi:predicted nucleic acid-binding protein